MDKEQIARMQQGRKNKSKKQITTDVIYMDNKRKEFFKAIDEDFPSKKKVFIKAFGGSLRAAINANCIACVWGDIKCITNCTSTICPLYEVRPYSKNKK